jgi:hypothetical protein
VKRGHADLFAEAFSEGESAAFRLPARSRRFASASASLQRDGSAKAGHAGVFSWHIFTSCWVVICDEQIPLFLVISVVSRKKSKNVKKT